MLKQLSIGLLFGLTAASQSAAPVTEFEVASVRPTQPGVGSLRVSGGPRTSDPERWSCLRCSLFVLVGQAYKVWEYQMVVPAWTQGAFFDVKVKVPPGTSQEDFLIMQQKLLRDRFGMTIHREKRELPVYELVVAKGGHKMKEVVEAAPPPPPAPALDNDGFPNIPGGSGMRIVKGHGRIQFRAQTMDNLAHVLSTIMGRPVLDMTGLTAKYALMLSWYQEPAPTPIPEASDIATNSIADAAFGSSIFKTIQDDLGLRLESKKASVDMLIIDHAEKIPIEN